MEPTQNTPKLDDLQEDENTAEPVLISTNEMIDMLLAQEARSVKHESAKHTPGPWDVFVYGSIIEVRAGMKHAVIPWSGFDESDIPLNVHKANARLIAAAPDLLAACQALVDVADGRTASNEAYWAAVNMARAAIAQANQDHFHHALDATVGLVAAAWLDEPFEDETAEEEETL